MTRLNGCEICGRPLGIVLWSGRDSSREHERGTEIDVEVVSACEHRVSKETAEAFVANKNKSEDRWRYRAVPWEEWAGREKRPG